MVKDKFCLFGAKEPNWTFPDPEPSGETVRRHICQHSAFTSQSLWWVNWANPRSQGPTSGWKIEPRTAAAPWAFRIRVLGQLPFVWVCLRDWCGSCGFSWTGDRTSSSKQKVHLISVLPAVNTRTTGELSCKLSFGFRLREEDIQTYYLLTYILFYNFPLNCLFGAGMFSILRNISPATISTIAFVTFKFIHYSGVSFGIW